MLKGSIKNCSLVKLYNKVRIITTNVCVQTTTGCTISLSSHKLNLFRFFKSSVEMQCLDKCKLQHTTISIKIVYSKLPIFCCQVIYRQDKKFIFALKWPCTLCFFHSKHVLGILNFRALLIYHVSPDNFAKNV